MEQNSFHTATPMLHNIDEISNRIIEDNTYKVWDVITGF